MYTSIQNPTILSRKVIDPESKNTFKNFLFLTVPMESAIAIVAGVCYFVSTLGSRVWTSTSTLIVSMLCVSARPVYSSELVLGIEDESTDKVFMSVSTVDVVLLKD
jgi:hypothetical protein